MIPLLKVRDKDGTVKSIAAVAVPAVAVPSLAEPHAESHKQGGTDPITPESIGASPKNHTHTADSLGVAEADHTHTVADMSGILPVERGGTGASTAEAARQALGITAENLGLARIIAGTYVGTGTYGKSNPNTITITPNTKMVLIQHDSGDYAGMAFRDCGLTNLTDGNGTCRASWSEDLLSWYYDGTNGAGRQLNYEGDTYHYFLFEG